MRFRVQLLLLLALPWLSACGFVDARFNEGLGLGSDSTLFIPFSEPSSYRWYGESPKGRYIVDSVEHWARSTWTVDFPAGDDVDRVLETVKDWPQPKISIKDWRELAMGLGVRYILVGEIKEFRITSPQVIGMAAPKVVCSYRVIDAVRGKIAYKREKKEVTYGTPEDQEIPIVDVGEDERKIGRRLLTKLAKEIGKELYGYYNE